MTDIVVTAPKDYNFPREKMGPGDYYWFMGRTPQHLTEGETIYFVWRGHLRFKARVTGVTSYGVDFTDAEELPEPWNTMSGFRGFMYVGAVK